MRRQFRGRSEAFVRSNDGEQGFWPSYADMMSAVALILFFVMLLSYIQNLITGNKLQNTKAALEDTETRLAATQELLTETRLRLEETQLELSGTQEELSATRIELEDTQASLALTRQEVENAQQQLDRVTIDLDEARAALVQQQMELAGQNRLLGEQRALIAQQETYLKAADEEIEAMRRQMQTIAVLRLSILEQIRDSMVKVMGDASKVRIGDSGNKPALDMLVDVFVVFLSDQENAKYVDTIVISGHTDSTGSDEDNRILSTDRANAVLGYLLTAKNGKLNPYASYFCASGYGETRPVQPNETVEGRAANRRIEISVILRDDSVMQIVENYLDIEPPKLPGGN